MLTSVGCVRCFFVTARMCNVLKSGDSKGSDDSAHRNLTEIADICEISLDVGYGTRVYQVF